MVRTNRLSGWSAGFAQVEITPRKGAPMSGFGRERYAKGAIAPLMAQALVLRAAGDVRQTIVFLAADILGFNPITLDLMRTRAAEKHGADPTAVVLMPSHTHWSSGAQYRLNFYAGKPNPYFMRELEPKLLKLMDDAFADLAPATVGYTSLEAKIGSNRRLPNPKGWIDFAVNVDGHYDTHTPVLRVRRQVPAQRGNDILLVTHASHPTSTGPIDKWSPDYPGALRDEIGRRLGDGARCVFGMGCGADAKVAHVDEKSGQTVFSASPKHAKQGGQRLARAVLAHLKAHGARPLEATVQARRATGQFTWAKRRTADVLRKLATDPATGMHEWSWARIVTSFPETRKRYEYEAVLLVLGGELSIIALPDEVCSPLGPRTRAQARTSLAMVIAYANTVQCYIPTAQIVREGGYEGESSHRSYLMPAPFTPKIDREFVGLIERLVR